MTPCTPEHDRGSWLKGIQYDLLLTSEEIVQYKGRFTLAAWHECGVSVAWQLRGFFHVFAHQKRV